MSVVLRLKNSNLNKIHKILQIKSKSLGTPPQTRMYLHPLSPPKQPLSWVRSKDRGVLCIPAKWNSADKSSFITRDKKSHQHILVLYLIGLPTNSVPGMTSLSLSEKSSLFASYFEGVFVFKASKFKSGPLNSKASAMKCCMVVTVI